MTKALFSKIEMGKSSFERRIASNRVSLDGVLLGRYAVELLGDRVARFYPLTEELPFTEWLPGMVEIITGADGVRRCII